MQSPPKALDGRGIARTSALATIGTIVGYSATMAQQFVYARALGVGSDPDALAAAMAWALSVTGLIGVTSASVIVPSYVAMAVRDRAAADRLFRSTAAASLTISTLAGLASMALAPALARILVPGSGGAAITSLQALLKLSIPLHVSWTLVILLTALANSRGHYLLASVATAVPSLGVIAALGIASSPWSVLAGYIVGFGAQAAVLVAALGWRTFWGRIALAEVRSFGSRAMPVAVMLAMVNVTGVLARATASIHSTGDVAVFDYASRFGVAVENVVLTGTLAVGFTVWSEDSAHGARQRLPLRSALVAFSVVGSLAASALFIGAPIVVALLFEGGQFSSADASRVVDAMRLISLAVAARVVYAVATRVILVRPTSRRLLLLGASTFLVVGASTSVGAVFGFAQGIVGFSVGWLLAAAIAARLATD